MTDQGAQRRFWMLLAAYATVIGCVAVTVGNAGIGEYAQGLITLVLGRFLGYIDNGYSFEFGTTRASKTKDETISNLAAGAAPIPPADADTKEQ